MDTHFNINKYTYSSMTLLEFIASAGGSSLLTKALTWTNKWMKIKRASKANAGIKAIVDVYGEMDWILSQTDLDRAHIYFLEDSGKTPNAAIPQYLTCIYETFGKPLISNRDDFERFLVDKSFISVFNVACEEGFCLVKKAEPFDASSKLRDIMLAGKMHHNQFFLLAQTEVKSFYIALSSTTHTYDDMNEDQRIKIRMGVDRIRGIFKDAIKHIK